jgi:glycosyltransferase involved in cell wall biosynthesis
VLASTYPRWAGDPEPGFVHELCKRLTREFTVTVVTPHARTAQRHECMDGVHVRRFRYAPPSLETLVSDGGIVNNLKRRPWKWLLVPGFLIASVISSLRIARTIRPDVVHAHWLIPQGVIAAVLETLLSRSPPFVVTSHGADLFALNGRIPVLAKRLVVGRAALVTAVSNSMAPILLSLGANKDRLAIASMGVDLDDRFVADPTVPRSRHEILFVGRFVEKKGLHLLIAAMPTILRAKPDAHLTVVGFGPEEARCRTLVAQLAIEGRVTFLGPVSQDLLPSLYRRAAVFVAPFVRAADGDQEGLGLVAIEAMGCGCPVVLGDVDAVAEVAQVAGDWAVVTPVVPDTLAAAVLRQMECPSPEKSLGALKARFGWHGVAERYSTWLQQVAMQRRR